MRIFSVLFFLTAILILASSCSDSSELVVPPSSSGVIYVRATGSDLFPGTANNPVRSINHGLELAIAQGAKEVRVAWGWYSTQDFNLVGGINITGGYDPNTWEANPDTNTIVKFFNTACKGMDILVPTVISNLEFQQRGSQPPLVLFGCGNELKFSQCIFWSDRKREGRDGGHGADGTPHSAPSTLINGSSGTCLGEIEASGGLSEYSFNSGNGGAGGAPGQSGNSGQDAAFFNEDHPGSGLAGSGGLPGQPGQNGTPGGPGRDGTNGTLAPHRVLFVGTQIEDVQASNGHYGSEGYPGGGGGGGGGSNLGTGNGGGAIGARARAGHNGSYGYAGSSSIAAACKNSHAVFEDCHFITSDGGNGGNGGNGGQGLEGTPGGLGGTECSLEVGAGGDGGTSGRGGHGGAGVGGHGGDCIGFWIVGYSEPELIRCSFELGTPGLGGQGGQHGDGTQIAYSGWDGSVHEILDESESQ